MQWFALFMKLFPAIEQAILTVAADKGKPAEEVVSDVIDHLTPGKPNAASLQG
jgi:hypothetical protein